MKRLALSAILLIGTAAPAFAAIDPAFAEYRINGVVDRCTQDATNSAVCVASTLDFLRSLQALDPSPGALDQYLADLVWALAPLAEDGVCNDFDIAISEAIRTAGNFADDAQRNQIVSIAQAIQSCRKLSVDLPRRVVPSRTT